VISHSVYAGITETTTIWLTAEAGRIYRFTRFGHSLCTL